MGWTGNPDVLFHNMRRYVHNMDVSGEIGRSKMAGFGTYSGRSTGQALESLRECLRLNGPPENSLGALREDLALTQTALASMSGVAQGYISEIESGKKRLSRKAAGKLAPVLGVGAGPLLASVRLDALKGLIQDGRGRQASRREPRWAPSSRPSGRSWPRSRGRGREWAPRRAARAAGPGQVPARDLESVRCGGAGGSIEDIGARQKRRREQRMSLMAAIRRAHAAKLRGGPDGKDGLMIAALLPSVEELADKVMDLDSEATEAEALEFAHHAREAALEVLEAILTDSKEEYE